MTQLANQDIAATIRLRVGAGWPDRRLRRFLSAIPTDLSHAMLTARDPAIRGLPKHSVEPPLGYACNAIAVQTCSTGKANT